MVLYLSQFCSDVVLEVLGGFGPGLLVAAFEATDELLQHRRRAGHGGSSNSRVPLPTREPMQREAALFQSPLHFNGVNLRVASLCSTQGHSTCTALVELIGDQAHK